MPDILDEAAWLPRFCYRLRHELLDKHYGTGGIGLRIAGDAFGDDEKRLPDGRKVGQGSWEDVDRTWAASGEDPWSTYRYGNKQLPGCSRPRPVFHMDAWYNGKDQFHPGIIPYGPWRKEKDQGQGPWDVAWPNTTDSLSLRLFSKDLLSSPRDALHKTPSPRPSPIRWERVISSCRPRRFAEPVGP